jgi:hypothetical protein
VIVTRSVVSRVASYAKHLQRILLLLLFHHYNVPNLCTRLFSVFVPDYTSGKPSIGNSPGPVGNNTFFLARLFGELTPELGNPMVLIYDNIFCYDLKY